MRAHLIVGIFISGLLAACSTETGMLISTSTTGDFNSEIDSLRFYVGTNNVQGATNFSDSTPAEDIDVNGRDLVASPYRLLLHPSGDDMGSIVVAAISLDPSGRINGFGKLTSRVDFISGSVVQWDLVITPDHRGVSVTPTDCLQWINDNGDLVSIGLGGDQDCDGAAPPDDCDDLNPAQSPNTPEDCFNGVDDNCNGYADAADTVDTDNDGIAACGDDGGDCNDNDALIHPDAEELCDAIDNNCNGECDEIFDGDKDGITSCGSNIVSLGDDGGTFCQYIGPEDCDDEDDTTYPGAVELCDGVDNNCLDGCSDEDVFDMDGDGYTFCASTGEGSIVGDECLGSNESWADCGPNDYYTHPGAHELCDGLDNNCDDSTTANQPTTCFTDIDPDLVNVDCREGVRGCENDTSPGDVCDTGQVNGPRLDPSWCDTYETCDLDGAISDAFQCSIDYSDSLGPGEQCTVRMSSTTEVCGGSRQLTLDLGGPTTMGDVCTYTIIGEGHQQGYKLSLNAINSIGPDVQSFGTIDACRVGLDVYPVPLGRWPGHAHYTIRFEDPMNTVTYYPIEFSAKLVEDCDGGPAVTCATLAQGFPDPSPL